MRWIRSAPMLVLVVSLSFVATSSLARSSAQPDSVRLALASDQLRVLKTIGARCGRLLGGNAAVGPAVAGLLLPLEVDTCPPISDASRETATIAVVPLRARGVNLLRIEQNFGGTLNLVRYVVVTAVRGHEGRTLVFQRALLPADTQGDAQAKTRGNAMFPSVAGR
jgi:hypothetical protein